LVMSSREFVKTSRPGESFWCEIIETFGHKAYKVRVDNDLIGTHLHGLKRGDIFVVKKSEIIESMTLPLQNPDGSTIIIGVHGGGA